MYRAFIIILFFHTACTSQSSRQGSSISSQLVGGPCEGCEAIYEYGDRQLTPIGKIPSDPAANSTLKISGIVYQQDGKTPAPNVILYLYQTNTSGVYVAEENAQNWARRHGKYRTWIKTDQNGQYTLHTFKPGSYPGRPDPAHIHLVVKEPDRNEYYLDDFIFADDSRLNQEQKQRLNKRGGSGILNLVLTKEGGWEGKRDIVLGMNIPNYD